MILAIPWGTIVVILLIVFLAAVIWRVVTRT